MTEKEFLINAFNYFAESGIYTQEKLMQTVERYLKDHHQTFYEVEFHRIDPICKCSHIKSDHTSNDGMNYNECIHNKCLCKYYNEEKI